MGNHQHPQHRCRVWFLQQPTDWICRRLLEHDQRPADGHHHPRHHRFYVDLRQHRSNFKQGFGNRPPRRHFFFQAEDGIREDLVTGVQTCALPIYLSYIYVTVGRCYHTQVFFAYTFSLCCKLCNGAEWGSFRSLTTCVRVNLCIQYQDVNIFATCDYMVETTVTDIVRSTVATDNPLTSLNEIVVECLQFSTCSTSFGSTCLNHRFQLFCSNLRCVCVIFACKPFLSSSFEFSRSIFFCYSLVEKERYTFFHLLVTKCHTHTEFAEVLEQ